MGQSFMPDFGKTSVVKGRPWLYTPILPLVFGAELSYMEQVAKLHMKVNELIQNDAIVGENFAKLVEAFKQWEEYLNGLTVADGAITTAKLADGAVTAPKIAQRAVESQHIAKGAVGSQELGEQAVEGHNLAVGAVDRFSKIADGVIILAHFSNEVIEAFGNKLPMPDNAQVGQYIRVSAVDDKGKVTATEAVDAPGGGNLLPVTIVSDTPANHVVVAVDGYEFTTEFIEEVEKNVDD